MSTINNNQNNKKKNKRAKYIPPRLKLQSIENNIKKLSNLIKNLDKNNNFLKKTGSHKNYLKITKNKLKEGLENLIKEQNITEIELKKHIEDIQKSRGTNNAAVKRRERNIQLKIDEITSKLNSIEDAETYDKRMLEFLKKYKKIESIGMLQMGKSKARKDLYADYSNMLDPKNIKNNQFSNFIRSLYNKSPEKFRGIYTPEKTNKEIEHYETKINSEYSYGNEKITIYQLYKIIYEKKLEELKFELKNLSGNLNNLIPPNKENLPQPKYTLFGVFKGSNLSGGKKKPVTKKPVTKKSATKKPVKKETSKKKPATKKPSSKKPVKKSTKK